MVHIDPLSRIDNELSSVESEINRLTALLASAETKKTELGVARRILGQIFDSAQGDGTQEGAEDKTRTISDEIMLILERDGALSKVEIHQKLEDIRGDINITTVSTTLSRMKSQDKVDNVGGKWIIQK